MKNKFNDWHLYLGAYVKTDKGFIGKVIGFPFLFGELYVELEVEGNSVGFPFSSVKFILRSLSDITDEELMEVMLAAYPYGTNIKLHERTKTGFFSQIIVGKTKFGKSVYNKYEDVIDAPIKFKLCLKKRFDLFNLIETNQAIDAKTLGDKNPYLK